MASSSTPALRAGELGPQGLAHPLPGDLHEAGELAGRDVAAGAQDGLQGLVGPRLLQEPGEALGREPRALVARDGAHDAGLAPVDDHVRDAFGERGAAREGEEMVLALRARDIDEVVVGQPGRAREHGARHRDVVVVGEVLTTRRGALGNVREAVGELDPGAELDVAGEPQDHLVEDGDVHRLEMRGLLDEERRHPAQGVRAARGIAAADGVLDFTCDGCQRIH
jgi:hypothetical protein